MCDICVGKGIKPEMDGGGLVFRGIDAFSYTECRIMPSSLVGLIRTSTIQNVTTSAGQVYPDAITQESHEEMAKKKAKSEEPTVDIKALDAVILSPSARRDILATLLQHKNKKLIMDDWGLGEVIQYGLGMTMLFHGLPGTGKTATAHCIAKAVNKELMEIDFGSLVSSEPGAYERNLSEAFAEAKSKKSVLFFDECDGMIQSRNGMGQIMSSMNNAFLKQVEKFDGIVVMATNRIGSLDGALERRLSCIVRFDAPGYDERKEIWNRLLPKKLPLHRRVDMDDIVSYALTGGQIKNVVLMAARYAAAREGDKQIVKHDDFVTAIEKVQEASRAFYDKENIATLSGGTIIRG